MSHILDPLSYITVPLSVFPNTVTMLLTILPFTIVSITVYPFIHAFPIHFTIHVVAHINISVAKTFIAFTLTLVLSPTTFIMSAVFIHTYAEALSLVQRKVYLSHIVTILIRFYCRVLTLHDFLQIEQISNHLSFSYTLIFLAIFVNKSFGYPFF